MRRTIITILSLIVIIFSIANSSLANSHERSIDQVNKWVSYHDPEFGFKS